MTGRTHSISVSVRSIISRKNTVFQSFTLYFHINLRLKVQTVLKYFTLIPSGSWDISIFKMPILLFFKNSHHFIPWRSQPCVIKLVHVSKRYSMGMRFWQLLEVNTIWKLLEAKFHWSKLILQFGNGENYFFLESIFVSWTP